MWQALSTMSKFYLHSPSSSANGMNHTGICPHSHQTFITIPYPSSSDTNPVGYSDALLNTMEKETSAHIIYHMKGQCINFCDMKNGWWVCPLLLEILGQIDPSLSKIVFLIDTDTMLLLSLFYLLYCVTMRSSKDRKSVV